MTHHAVRRLIIEAELSSQDEAFALQPRLAELARRLLPQVIERVLDQEDRPDEWLRLERLELDLGTLPLAGLEQALAEALEAALRDALRERRAAVVVGSGAPEDRRASADESLPALLEHYLTRGTLPFWAPEPAGFAAEAVVLELSDRQPMVLAALLRRAGQQREVLDRLTRQLSDPALQRLLAVLDPEHAALILGCLLDIRTVHDTTALVPLGERDFGRLLWLLTLTWEIRDPGSQFNRKSFLRRLLDGMAEAESVDAMAILTTLHRGLALTLRRIVPGSSLPAVVAELAAEAGLDRPPPPRPAPLPSALERLERLLADGASAALEALVLELAGSDPAGLAEMIRRLARHRPQAERLAAALGEAALRRLLSILEPENAVLILVYMGEIADSHRVEPLIGAGADRLRRLLWLVTLCFTASDSAAGFNRKSYLRALLEGLASAEGLDYAAVVVTLRRGLGAVARRLKPGGSLPALIGELAAEALPGWPTVDVEALFRRGDHRHALRHYLLTGRLPWSLLLRRPNLSAETLLAELPRLTRDDLLQLLDGPPRLRRPALRRLAALLPTDAFHLLLARLLPAAEDGLAGRVAQVAATTAEPVLFHARLLEAALDGRTLDLDLLAAADGLDWLGEPDDSAEALKEAVVEGLRGDVTSPPWTQALDALMAGSPDQARRFLFALGDSPGQAARLAERLPPELARRAITLLRPAEAVLLRAFDDALTRLPAAHRPRSVSTLLLETVLGLGEGGVLTAAVFARLLRRLFGDPPPVGVRRSLTRRLTLWRKVGSPPAPHVALLAEALGGPPDGTEAETPPPSPPPPDPRRALFAFLRGEDGDRDGMVHQLTALLAVGDEATVLFLRRHLLDPALRAHWVAVLPEPVLMRLLVLVEPHRPTQLLDAARLLAGAWCEASGQDGAEALSWRFLLDFLATTAAPQRSVERLLPAFLATVAAEAGQPPPLAVAEAMLAGAARRARDAGNAVIASTLKRSGNAVLGVWTAPKPAPEPDRPRGALPPVAGRTAFGMTGDVPAVEEGDVLYIANAGLVLCGPFLSMLFQRLDLIEDGTDGASPRLRPGQESRAVRLLQWLVDGEGNAPEALLAFNKILCGLDTTMPIDADYQPSDEEIEIAEGLLAAMVEHWIVIRGSSLAALRETFLCREGRLVRNGADWRLRVQRKTVDVLVDQIPWGFSVINHPWMTDPVYTTW